MLDRLGFRSPRPLRYGAALAVAYTALAGAYIVVSGQLAAKATLSVDDLARFEQIKGLAFVGVTGAALFVLSTWMFHRLSRAASRLGASREALLHADRRATPGLLAASIAHDFNNVLSVLRTNVEALDTADEQERKEIVADLLTAITRGAELARSLAQAGRSSASGVPVPVDLTGVTREALALVAHLPKGKDREVRLEPAPSAVLTAHPTLVHQIVTNLVINAMDAAGPGGHVQVRVVPTDGAIALEVHDDGPGVPDALRGLLFDPFYTTKPDGTGLGLVSVRTCAAIHRGNVEVSRSTVLRGACFRVTLRDASPPPAVS